jgi:hypothetical protein
MFSERGDHGRRFLAGDLEKHYEAGVALDERRNVRVVCAREKDLLPSGPARRGPQPPLTVRGWGPYQ